MPWSTAGMNGRTWIRHKLRQLWGQSKVQYGTAAAACGLAIWMQQAYRLEFERLRAEGMRRNDAVKVVAEKFGLRKNDVYKLLL